MKFTDYRDELDLSHVTRRRPGMRVTGLAILLSAASFLFAQGTTSQINGTVRDASGAGVPDAQITVTNVDTQVNRKTTSGTDGSYVVPLLSPGNYQISVQKQGFRPMLRSAITLELDQVATIDLQIQIGSVSETIEVTAAGPLLAVTNSTLGEVVNNTQIQNLPMNGRQTFRLLALSPGVFKAPSSNGQFQDIPVNQSNETIFSIGGGRARSNEVMIDGIPTTVGSGNTITVIPPVESTEEFNVMSGPLRAEWGRTGGGVLNVYTKAGGNRVHGALFEFVRDGVFDANDFFANTVGQSQPEFRLNQYGFTLGGPVWIPKVYKGVDKSFFFVDYQGTRWRQGATFRTTVPTPEQRQGDFAGTLDAQGRQVTIYNPFTTVANPNAAGQFIRTPFPGNKIPASMLNPVSQKVVSYVPLPNIAGNQFTNLNNFLSGATRSIDEHAFGIRGDHNISDRQKLFGRFAFNRNNLVQPNYFGSPASSGEGALGTVVLNAMNGSLHSTTTFSPNSILSVGFGYARWVWNRSSNSYGFDQRDLGLPASYVSQLQYPLFPTLTVENGGGIGGGSGYNHMAQNTGSLMVSLTRISGRHTLKMGFDGRVHRDFLIGGDPGGSYRFTQAMTNGPNPNVFASNAGSGVASLMLGTFSTGSVNLIAGSSQQSFYYAGYIQDDFRVNSKLTLNYGLRWETTSPITERNNQISRMNLSLPSPARNAQFPNLVGGLEYASPNNRTLYGWDLNNWSPRFGFAYHILPTMVVRGGAGLVYSQFPTSYDQIGFAPNQGFLATTTFNGTLDGVTPHDTFSNPAPQGLVQPTPASSLGASTFLGQNINAWDLNARTPQVWQWNFDVQREWRGFLFDAAYVGIQSQNLHEPLQIDALHPTFLPLGSQLQQLVPNPFYGTIDSGALSTATVARWRLLLPYPQYTGIALQNSTWGHSSYNAMQLKLKKRFSNGISLLATYTASKLFSDVANITVSAGNSQDNGLNASVQNPYNLQAERSVSEADTPNYATFAIVSELPFGPGRKFLAGARGWVKGLVGGWELSNTFIYRSGFPLSFSSTGTLVGTRPNRTCSGAFTNSRSKGERVQQWFDRSCFPVVPAFSYGNDSRTNPDVRGPSFTQIDSSLAKRIKVFHEAADLIFRAEAFNLFNTPHFAPPVLNANASNFGQITVTSGKPRVLQFALKLTF